MPAHGASCSAYALLHGKGFAGSVEVAIYVPFLFTPRSKRRLAPAVPARRAFTYMPQLDGLRALAVLAVLWTHYLPEPYWLFGVYWGGYGVRLFFVLSGFLITTLLLSCRHYVHHGQQRRSVVLRQFYCRRFLRLCPLYYATLTVTALLNIAPVRETLCGIFHICPMCILLYEGRLTPRWRICGL